MLVVMALDESAILRRGELMTADNLLAGIREAGRAIAPIAADHQVVIALGSGPEVSLLALQSAAHARVEASFNALACQFESLMGGLLQRELVRAFPRERPVATARIMVEVDATDPAFDRPTTVVGPVYLREEADRLAAEQGWTFSPDSDKWRRVVAAPEPKRIIELRPITWLLERGAVVIAEGGGLPMTSTNGHRGQAIDCAIGGALVAELLARELDAELFVLLSEADALYIDSERWDRRAIRRGSPAALRALSLTAPAAAMRSAACRFTETTGRTAAIGSLGDLSRMMNGGEAGTTVTTAAIGIDFGPPRHSPDEPRARSANRRFCGPVPIERWRN